MKLFFCLFLLIAVLIPLSASVGYTYVNMENNGTGVTRVVVGLSEKAKPVVNRTAKGLELQLTDYDRQSNAMITFKPGGIVSGVEQNGGTITLAIGSAFRYETLNLGNRVAVDVYIQNPNKSQRLQIADFYADKGKLASADKAYNDLHIDYREDTEILYHWAELLAKRGSARATDKLSMIPSGSPYYKQAQSLMAKLHGDEEPLPPPPPPTKEEAMATSAEIAPIPAMPADSIIRAPQPITAEQPESKTISLLRFLPLVGVEALLLIVFLIVISIALKKKKKSPVSSPKLERSENPGLDTRTMCRMVSKLLSDGWTLREISKELKISQKEVESLVQLCHMGGHDELNA